MDATSNKSKEDSVVITGLRSKEPMPEENRARNEWLKKITMDLFEKIIPKFPGKIFYLRQRKRMDVFLVSSYGEGKVGQTRKCSGNQKGICSQAKGQGQVSASKS